ncbi:hypothetical protein KIN20_022731 [Parelaphostrongylus tenuis]|uniref:Uncharacterized protein n=1 Tax=Parelaphostrongylus tenuis TaxID=148309 RepID=A0AAD5N9C7_PARTN|nr:hypothetical protein KIN20_022731 [Parelaphostrongylus tenuis]
MPKRSKQSPICLRDSYMEIQLKGPSARSESSAESWIRPKARLKMLLQEVEEITIRWSYIRTLHGDDKLVRDYNAPSELDSPPSMIMLFASVFPRDVSPFSRGAKAQYSIWQKMHDNLKAEAETRFTYTGDGFRLGRLFRILFKNSKCMFSNISREIKRTVNDNE